eukprot:scaffold202_cov149-Skeletonema_marinoi.AAC.4
MVINTYNNVPLYIEAAGQLLSVPSQLLNGSRKIPTPRFLANSMKMLHQPPHQKRTSTLLRAVHLVHLLPPA